MKYNINTDLTGTRPGAYKAMTVAIIMCNLTPKGSIPAPEVV